VNGIGYVADRDIGQALKSTIGLTLDEQHVYTTVKGAIVGPSSMLNEGGRSLTVTVTPAVNKNGSRPPWHRLNPCATWRSSAVTDSKSGVKQSRTKTSTLMSDVQSSSEPLECLQRALVNKVSVMTMINSDDIRVDRGLDEYGLDSLVSVELRNWIRREFGAELALAAIVGAEGLRALSEKILSLMPAKAQI
jgi:acyl carrier protein